ncbi:MAG: aminotransferase class III-fold pyridoxal phosphate-dependent enzyme, partial [Bacteroidota bacterium]
RVFADAMPHAPALLFRLGELCGKLSSALRGFDHPAAHRFIKWDPQTTEWVAQHLHLFTGNRRALAEHFLKLFREVAVPAFGRLRTSVNYNDANDFNVLISHDAADPVVPGVIDFGDLVHTHTVNELAIGLAYAVMHKPDPLEAAMHVVRGYHAAFPLTDEELEVLFPLMGARLLISVTCSGINLAEHPENTYLQISDRPAWELLEKLGNIHPQFAHACFRNACGMEPAPFRHAFDQWVRTAKPVMPVELTASPEWLDLSIGSTDLGTMSDILDAAALEQIVEGLRRQTAGGVALGRYGEARPIYSTDSYVVSGNDGPKWRSIHIGLDIFCDPGTPARAAFSGVIHAFANNAGERDYGPTIVLRHDFENGNHFFTLYGHLTLSSLDGLAIGTEIRVGEVVGAVGIFRENGSWPPHLHFQVMLDMLGNTHDFPGVCPPDLLPVWKSICPDPWKVLTGEPCPAITSKTKENIVGYRRQHLGKNLSISYKDPIIMLRGDRQYMIDHLGRRYLDTVNNVAHVGHEHPRVVRAGQRQMAVLNTNTRYLHENIITFTEELLATVPAPLDVVFLVNSGSEANELAIRLARTYTGQRDMIVSQTGYHGNTNMCVEVSSYKFDGPGGKGAEPHIHVVPMPDTYRGLYRAEDRGAGLKYAAHVGGAISKIRTAGKGVAAMLFESVISCGGQVELPAGFLKESYRMVRAAGGLCIADEVQTGCGRAGDHFWAFEAHDVVPDILTIGKPIG